MSSLRPRWRSRQYAPRDAVTRVWPTPIPEIARSYRFSCPLASQPHYLVPDRLFSPEIASLDDSWIVNPGAWLPGERALAPELLEGLPWPEAFPPPHELIWIPDPLARIPTPYWLDAELKDRLASWVPGAPPTGVLPRRLHQSLVAVGLLTPANPSARPRGDEPGQEARREQFGRRGYVALHRLLPPCHIAALRVHYRQLLRRGGMRLGDSGSPRRFVLQDEAVARFYHAQLAARVSAVAGVAVKPSYVYVAAYQSGAALKEHRDREQCEYSISLLLDHTPEPVDVSPWPLYLRMPEGPVAIPQGVGDALLYRGREFAHFRTPLPAGMTSTSIFFHYVDEAFEGPLD